MNEQNPYLPYLMNIDRAEMETDDDMLMTFDLTFQNLAEKEAFFSKFNVGQFCEISVFGKGEAPFGVASSSTEQDFVRFTVNKAGVMTKELHRMCAGDTLGMRGPMGNGWPLDVFAGHDLVIIGGGFAFTTLRALIVYALHPDNRAKFGKITVIYGARTPGLLLYKDDLAAWEKRDDIEVHLTVDREFPGWEKHVGFVPDVLERVAPSANGSYAIICGPPVMIRFTMPRMVALKFAPEQIYLSLERRMKCGLGKCGRCNVGPYYVCKDGPVFSYAELEGLPAEY